MSQIKSLFQVGDLVSVLSALECGLFALGHPIALGRGLQAFQNELLKIN